MSWVDFGDANATTTRAEEIQIPERTEFGHRRRFGVRRITKQTTVQWHIFFITSTGTFGPLASNGSWTTMMYTKTDRPVNKRRRGVHRAGRPMVLLSCPAVGRSIELPMPDILGYHNNTTITTVPLVRVRTHYGPFHVSPTQSAHTLRVCFTTNKTVLAFFCYTTQNNKCDHHSGGNIRCMWLAAFLIHCSASD